MTAIDLSHYVTPGGDGACHIDLAVEGITCAACIGDIEERLKRLPGVTAARVNYTLSRVGVDWRDGAIEPATLIETLGRSGYRAHPFSVRTAESQSDAEMRRLLKALAIAGFAAMNIMLLSVSVWAGNVTDITPETRDFFHWVSALIALPAAAFAGQPFFASAFRALRAGRTNMDVPISIGVTLALGVSVYETAVSAEHAYFDGAIMLLFFLLAGRVLDQAMRRKTRALAGNLAAFRADSVDLLDADGTIRVVPAVAVPAGSTVVVQPGRRIAADGEIVAGASSVDESLVTGETRPRAVTAGDRVHAGTLNGAGALTVKVTAAARDTLVDEVQSLLEKAVEARSRRVDLADRAARLYAPVVHLTALLSAIGWLVVGADVHHAVVIAATVLIITCPCALALAVPAVQVVAAGALFRRGIFLNAGNAIERLAEADLVLFDKTGTLPLPDPAITDLAAVPSATLARAARLALSSRHPLARVLAAHAGAGRPFAEVHEAPGEGLTASIDGIEARLGSPAFCGIAEGDASDPTASRIAFRRGDETAVFTIRQALRPDAAAVVAALKARGLASVILSGDRREAVAPIAAALGIDTFAAGLRPGDKIAALEAFKAEGRRVLMVGDGLNDAPALAAAHVALSPITAIDLTQAQADAVFLGERLQPVVEAVDISRKARRLMSENLVFSVVYNAFAVPLAILGLVTPLIAAVAMSGSSIVVTLNALRAKPRASRSEPAPSAVMPAPREVLP